MVITEKEGYTIIIRLPEECGYTGYSVKCTYKYIKQKEKYSLSMWLMKSASYDKFKINLLEIGTEYIYSSKSNVENNIRKLVINAALSGYFDEYVECFDSLYGYDMGTKAYSPSFLRQGDDCLDV